jgi:hypothetical protein
MLAQGLIQYGNSVAFIDKQSDVCVDGKPCDNLGDHVWEVEGRRIYERDFKEYRKFSPQFRYHLIMEYFQNNDMRYTMESCSCSKCKTVSYDERWWL